MDTSDSAIVFDELGVCDHCRTFRTQIQPNWHTDSHGERALAELVKEIKASGKDKDFDCIIGMSGGIDSSYLTYLAKERFGLRPLVFHVDAGWNSQTAVNNIERLIDGLELDLFTEVIDWEEIKEDAKRLLIERFGWQPYPQKHFESRFTRFYESYWLPERFGYDVRKVQFSSLILTGQMTRAEALQQLQTSPYDSSSIHVEKEFIANKLGIDVNELDSYMRLPKRTYRDYKSQRQVYDAGAGIMRLLGLELGGKR